VQRLAQGDNAVNAVNAGNLERGLFATAVRGRDEQQSAKQALGFTVEAASNLF
jgi:hypothetical protein